MNAPNHAGARNPEAVGRLLREQFPDLADLPLEPYTSSATDNVVYRLGKDLLVRLPQSGSAADQVAKDARWLPLLAPHLPVEIPTIVGEGRPSELFPWPWSVQKWIDGRDAGSGDARDRVEVAATLGDVVRELRRVDTTDAPMPSAANSFRGAPVATRDDHVRHAARFAEEMGPGSEFTAGLDVAAVMRIWQSALDAAPWDGPPVWIHGDLIPGNILMRGAELAALIDFGCAAVGDPAGDMMAAWTLFAGEARKEFLARAHVDDDTRARARGWAAYVGITAMPYHHDSNRSFCAFARGILDDLLTTE